MITLIYTVEHSNLDEELKWLHDQKIFPAVTRHMDWKKNAWVNKIGVIVSPEAALTIKLRHAILSQEDYRQR